jgi:hypothetical protein
MTIIEHVEKYLGQIDQGWKDNDSDDALQVVSFKDTPGETVSTYLSLGLSKLPMTLSEDKEVRQELVFSVYSMVISSMVVSFMLSLCEAIIGRGKAILRGEVIPLSKEVAKRIGFDAVYCTNPVFFDGEFCDYDESSPPTVIVWMLPIYQSEVDYISAHGWESFEDLLEEKDPDLCSLERNPVI